MEIFNNSVPKPPEDAHGEEQLPLVETVLETTKEVVIKPLDKGLELVKRIGETAVSVAKAAFFWDESH
jgi:hypothetical protein